MTEMKKEGSPAHHVEGLEKGRWVLLDFVDFVVHVFHPTLRDFYQLERLWADAEQIPVDGRSSGACDVGRGRAAIRRGRRARAGRQARRAARARTTSARTRSSTTSSSGRSWRPNTSRSTTTLKKRAATDDAARMAERAYARLSRVLDHQFREKKPIMLFSSRADFGQNNVTGDLGEGTGGVTEATAASDAAQLHRRLSQLRARAHARDGARVPVRHLRARQGRQRTRRRSPQYLPPLWFAEGMAEYLSLGPSSTLTNDVDARRRAERQASRRSSR